MAKPTVEEEIAELKETQAKLEQSLNETKERLEKLEKAKGDSEKKPTTSPQTLEQALQTR